MTAAVFTLARKKGNGEYVAAGPLMIILEEVAAIASFESGAQLITAINLKNGKNFCIVEEVMDVVTRVTKILAELARKREEVAGDPKTRSVSG